MRHFIQQGLIGLAAFGLLLACVFLAVRVNAEPKFYRGQFVDVHSGFNRNHVATVDGWNPLLDAYYVHFEIDDPSLHPNIRKQRFNIRVWGSCLRPATGVISLRNVNGELVVND